MIHAIVKPNTEIFVVVLERGDTLANLWPDSLQVPLLPLVHSSTKQFLRKASAFCEGSIAVIAALNYHMVATSEQRSHFDCVPPL